MPNFWQKIKTPILVLAPMEGITDSSFREICHRAGADVVYTEMTSIDALYYDSKNTIRRLNRSCGEGKTVLQLFGRRPELIAKAVKYVEEAGFYGIDLNFGCPAKRVVAHEGGISLLRDLNLVRELVQATVEAATVPVSVKTRISINKLGSTEKITVFDFIEKIKDLNVSTLMLHGRSYEQGFAGGVDYEVMRRARAAWPGIFIANGGINTPEDAKILLDKTGADGLALARGIYGRPYLFTQIHDYLRHGKYEVPDLRDIKKIAWNHAKLLEKNKGEHGMLEIRKHLCWYFKGFPGASDWRKELVQVADTPSLKKVLRSMK